MPEELTPPPVSVPRGKRVLTRLRAFILPLLVGLAIAAASVGLRDTLLRQERTQIEHMLELETALVKSDLGRQMESYAVRLVRLARRWEHLGHPLESEWRHEAGTIFREGPMRALEWRKPTLDAHWWAPALADRIGSELDPRDEEMRRGALENARNPEEIFFAQTIPVTGGRRQVLIRVPLFSNGKVSGYFIGVARLRELLDSILRSHLAHGYSIAVSEGPYLIYGPAATWSGFAGSFAKQARLEIDDLLWKIEVWPSEDLLRRMSSPLPSIAFGVGLGVAAAAALAIWLLQSPRRRGRELLPPGQAQGSRIDESQRAEPGMLRVP